MCIRDRRKYISEDRPFLGICIGFQVLFGSSQESPGKRGLGLIAGDVERFSTPGLSVPHMGWNQLRRTKSSLLSKGGKSSDFLYFVHSFCVQPTEQNKEWVLTETDYGAGSFVSSVQKGRVCGTQYHPEKSGAEGLRFISNFLESSFSGALSLESEAALGEQVGKTQLSRRVIACLDVRSNDQGDLVVTKGDQYDVRETDDHEGAVRNLGKPVALAQEYYELGADEITFLNITSFRENVLNDLPMIKVLQAASEKIFVPLCVGGGIRDTDEFSALEVADAYFRAGADKVSIGSDAVAAAEAWHQAGKQATGTSCMETISRKYGRQAVVVSVDPKRVYVKSPAETTHPTIELAEPQGPDGERFCWYACTVQGGRKVTDLDVFQLVEACEALGAGEVLLNSIDQDGQGKGFDLQLVEAVKRSIEIPVIASSGAGTPHHFVLLFSQTPVEAGLAAGIFHRKEVGIDEVKAAVAGAGMPARGAACGRSPQSDGEDSYNCCSSPCALM
eukprot:TRINITY_DN2402_c0_g1_i4.p1 TRINITY_DN2402_c0_g1~~TRINITY_DN2402_c0_g1_i4.p1  ORF type:complete len:503 (-),score=113.30 TRINITY_DN2402_c0_g1_i4:374-1882(-)